jgi:exodeoxyribonuclease VII small subunit
VVTRKIERTREAPLLGGEPPGSLGGQPTVSVGGQPTVSLGGQPTVSFEQAIARLGEIVESLEEGEQPLEESLALFEEGMSLAKSSQEILDRAERRIEELLGVDAQGRPVVREIDPD